MPRHPETMYRWRNMNDAERRHTLTERRQQHRPFHSVPHRPDETRTIYMITAACFEHAPVIGKSPARMAHFEAQLIERLEQRCTRVFTWTVLPNHYHILIQTRNVPGLLGDLGKLHGRNSFYWNGEDDTRGRQVWCNAAETVMKSEGHFYATVNYVLHNAVKHGYVEKWTDWPHCNAREYLESVGREKALEIWRSYPIGNYGDDWDPADL
jgi:putative transposase